MLDQQPIVYIDDWVANPEWLKEDNTEGLTQQDWENEVQQFAALIEGSRDIFSLD